MEEKMYKRQISKTRQVSQFTPVPRPPPWDKVLSNVEKPVAQIVYYQTEESPGPFFLPGLFHLLQVKKGSMFALNRSQYGQINS